MPGAEGLSEQSGPCVLWAPQGAGAGHRGASGHGAETGHRGRRRSDELSGTTAGRHCCPLPGVDPLTPSGRGVVRSCSEEQRKLPQPPQEPPCQGWAPLPFGTQKWPWGFGKLSLLQKEEGRGYLARGKDPGLGESGWNGSVCVAGVRRGGCPATFLPMAPLCVVLGPRAA